jgi:tetratricopeptide (TPR) repeat protein
MIPELDNRLFFIAQQVVFGTLLPQHAIEKVQQDRELSSLSDERLLVVIEEADRSWREKLLRVAVRYPKNSLIYPVLMAACAEVRLKAIGQFRRGADEKTKPSLDLRMAEWLTIMSRCLTAKGMGLLLLPEPQAAWETFTDANIAARALPDFGQLRLREVLAACYGRRVAAMIGRQKEAYDLAEQEFAGLMQLSNREQEAQAYLAEIVQEFEPIREVLNRRQAKPPEQETADDKQSSDDPATYAAHYMEQLNFYGGMLQAGRMQPEKAKEQLLASIDLSRLTAQQVSFISISQRQLAASAPDRAVLLAELNYAVASSLEGDKSDLTRAYCAYALAEALTAKARYLDKETNNTADYRRAIVFYEEALAMLDDGFDLDSIIECALMYTQMAVCYRGLGEFEKAIETGKGAVLRLKPVPEQGVRLGVAYGNIADVQEQIGDLASARSNHYQALQLFLESRDLLRIDQALFYFFRVCERMGRLDDAIAAMQRVVPVMLELAALESAIRAYLALASLLFRTLRIEDALGMLQQAEDLLEPQLTAAEPERRYLLLYADLQIWNGSLYTMLLHEPSGQFTLDRAARFLENARHVATIVKDDNLFARTMLQMADLYEQAGQYERAEQLCDELESVHCDPIYLTRREDIKGVLRLRRKLNKEAIEYFQRATAGYGNSWKDRKMIVQYHIGEAHEGARQMKEAVRFYESAVETFEQSRLALYEESRMEIRGKAETIYDRLISLYADSNSEVFNPQRALFWLEKSKSRTFVEAMGLSTLSLQPENATVEAILVEERMLLEKLNALRNQLFHSPEAAFDHLGPQQEMYAYTEKLNDAWGRLSVYNPEYVELRQGRVVDWDDVQSLLSDVELR